MSRDNQFGILAGYYDILNYNADYKKTADYIEKVFEIYNKKPKLVLDLACGTGNLTLELDGRGYDMTGLDLSADMLTAASAKKSSGNILWINQDMRGFELYGTVDAVVCCYDSLNYITDEEGVIKCFKLVHNYLDPGGLFIFDVNSEYKFGHIYAGSNFVLENKNVFCSWQNYYDKKNKVCDFYINIFVMQQDGRYARHFETQREKYYSEEFLGNALDETGFGGIKIFYDFETETGNETEIEIEIEQKNKRKAGRLCFAGVKI